MGAIIRRFSLDEIVVRTLAAGHDILFFSNNPLAAQAQGVRHDEGAALATVAGAGTPVPDSELPEKVQRIVTAALAAGTLSARAVANAFRRVVALRKGLAGSGLGT